jgi:vacuolar iron transporter family protein
MSFSILSIVNRAKPKKPLKEPHSSHSFLSDFILGSQDGLVNVLGILLGISAATSDVRIIYVGALAALGAESISMGAVAYTSTLSRRRLYQKSVAQEQLEMKQVPATERGEVRSILSAWGYNGTALETMCDGLASNPKAMQEFMMSFELKLAPVAEDEARRSFAVVLSSTIFGSFIPLIPFFFVTAATITSGSIASVIVSGALLFFIGAYEARKTVGSVWWSGLQMTIIGLSAGFAGYLIGHLIGAVPGL